MPLTSQASQEQENISKSSTLTPVSIVLENPH